MSHYTNMRLLGIERQDGKRMNADETVAELNSLAAKLAESEQWERNAAQLLEQAKARAEAAEAREAKLREALESIDWHVRRGMPIGAFANVAREALSATVTGIPVTPDAITDTQRLDWLDRHRTGHGANSFSVMLEHGALRAAIDAAMRQEGASR